MRLTHRGVRGARAWPAAVGLIAASILVGCTPSLFQGDDHDSTDGTSTQNPPGTTTGGSTTGGSTTGGTTTGGTTTGGSTTGGTTTGGTTTGGTTTGGTTTGGTTGGTTTGGTTGAPPFGGSSNGTGRGQGDWYTLLVPSAYSESSPNPLLIGFSGTEDEAGMANNMRQEMADPRIGIGGFIVAVLDGDVELDGSGDTAQDGARALDDIRARYNIDNDRTYLLSESAGTSEGIELGFRLRQAWFAAYWVNDITTSGATGAVPQQTASELGFAPWGNVGPGGKAALAQQLVDAMRAAGYRLPPDAPYSGTGSTMHGSPAQFEAALMFFPGKSRQ